MKSAFFAYLIGKRNPFAGEKSLFLGWQWHGKAGVESDFILEVYSVFPGNFTSFFPTKQFCQVFS